MKKLYTVLLISLMTCSLTAQSFTEIIGTPFEGSTNSVAFADFDNDNDQDVLIGSKLYSNDGTGIFVPTWTTFDAVLYGSSTFADIDNDNDQDVIISWVTVDSWEPQYHYFHTMLFTNDGNGSYIGSTPFESLGLGSIAFADVDNDNDLDVLISGFAYWISSWGPEYPQTTLYLNDGSGNFVEFTGTPFEGVAIGSISFADVDNDNDQDVLINGINGGGIPTAKLYTNDGSGNFTEISGTPFNGVVNGNPYSYSNGSIAFADIDNDNDWDVLIAGSGLYTNDGNGNFTEVEGSPFDLVSYGSVAFADIDNDNNQDVMITGLSVSDGTIAKLYINDGSGNFTEITNTPFEGVSNSSIAFADIDNDNDQDVLISGINNSEQNIAKLYLNNAINTEVLETKPLFNDVAIYPNPNQGQVTIDIGGLSNVSINVYSLSGQLIYHKENIMDSQFQLELTTETGIYILELSNQQEKQYYKLIKE